MYEAIVETMVSQTSMLFWGQGLVRVTTVRRGGIVILGTLLLWSAVSAFQRPFRELAPTEYEKFPLPADFRTPGEWVFGRLMYPPVGNYYGGFQFLGSWKEGISNWAMDYPRSDRHFAQAVRRLTRLQARSVEQPVNPDDPDIFDWPWLYGVEMGHWNPTEAQAGLLREFLLRGGFLMCDDFHGSVEWDVFSSGMKKVFPERPIVELDNANPIFHTIYDLDTRYQVPGELYVETGKTYEKGESGKTPHWRGIFDDNGRLMVAICHNMDLGDSWEHADNPQYPEAFSALGLRIGLNYLIYSMTH
jgi:hypothetical protein